jgi:hypothetical protein
LRTVVFITDPSPYLCFSLVSLLRLRDSHCRGGGRCVDVVVSCESTSKCFSAVYAVGLLYVGVMFFSVRKLWVLY